MREDRDNPDLERRSILANVESDNIRASMGNRAERRGFLKRTLGVLGGTVASTLGLSNRTSAAAPVDKQAAIETAQRFNSDDKISEVVEKYLAGPLGKLHQEGYLEQTYISDLPITRVHRTPNEFAEAREGTLILTNPHNTEPLIKVQIKRRLSDGRKLLLVVQPVSGKSRAVVQEVSAEGNTSTVQTAARTADGDVTTQGCAYCSTFYYCEEERCTYWACYCDEVKVEACDSDGDNCNYCETIGECCGTDNCSL